MSISQQTDLGLKTECLQVLPDSSQEFWKIALDAFHGSVVITDISGTVLYVNQRCLDVSGYCASEVIGKQPNIFRSGRVVDWTYQSIWSTILRGGTWRGLLVNRKKSGEEYAEYVKISPIQDSSGKALGYIAFKELLTHPEGEKSQGLEVISYDALTHLPNREYLKRTLNERVVDAIDNKNASSFYFLIVDIDHFHAINEQLGGEAADAFLAKYAQRLRTAVGKKGFVARLGPDEFGIILDADVLSDFREKGEESDWLVDLRNALARSMTINNGLTAAAACIGLTKVPSHAEDSGSEVIRRAAQALRQAKNTGDQTKVILSLESKNAAATPSVQQSELLAAIDNREIQLHLQAIVDRCGSLRAGESLARWISADGNIIPPGAFLDSARKLGKMGCLTRQFLDQIVAFQKDLFFQGIAIPISLNVEAREYLSGEFKHHLIDSISRSGLPKRLFKLELSERAIVNDLDAVARQMQELRSFGVRHSLDDFGTGYSSLTHLADLPIDEIKIDRSFVHRLPFHKTSCTLCRSVLSIARELCIDAVVEGVETKAHADFFSEWEDVRLQGFLFDRPTSKEVWQAKWL